jgi:prophage tail gpP-like protein
VSEVITLKISDKRYEGWLGFSISLGIETLANQFRLRLTDNWIDKKQIWPIIPGDKAEILLDGQKLITGYIDEVSPRVDASAKSLDVSGRDLAGDLVDCSAAGSEYAELTLDKIASLLAKPFGIKVNKKTSVGIAFPKITISQGETVFEVLDKRARARGVLLVSNANGEVDIMLPGGTKANTALIEGKNILSASATFDAKDRFSKYTVKSQVTESDEQGTAGFKVIGVATDEGVTRYRPLIIQAEAQAETVNAKSRANYEAIVRAARAATMSVQVKGFRQGNGDLWKPNLLVGIEAPSIGVPSLTEMLITQVTFSLDENGSITTLDLKRRDAFIAQEKVTKSKDPWGALYKKGGGK